MAEASLAMGVLPPGTQVLSAPMMPVSQSGLNTQIMNEEGIEDDEEWNGDCGTKNTAQCPSFLQHSSLEKGSPLLYR